MTKNGKTEATAKATDQNQLKCQKCNGKGQHQMYSSKHIVSCDACDGEGYTKPEIIEEDSIQAALELGIAFAGMHTGNGVPSELQGKFDTMLEHPVVVRGVLQAALELYINTITEFSAALELAQTDLQTWRDETHHGDIESCDCLTCVTTLPAIARAISRLE